MFNNDSVKEVDNEFDPDSFNHYLYIELAIDHSEEHPEYTRVTEWLKDSRDNFIGTANNNPILDIRMHKVKYHDRSK